MSKIIKGDGETLFDSTLLEVGRRGSIVFQEELLATELAREILSETRAEAARIRAEAEKLLQEAVCEKEEERKRGYDEGYQEGLAQLTGRMAEVETERVRLLAAQEGEIVQMVLSIAEKIVAHELKKKAIVTMSRQAIAQAVGQQLVLRLNPADKKKMEKGSDWEAIQKAGRRISLVADETLKPGDCIVESELGTVDARLENQWKAIRNAMGVEN